VDDLRQGKRRVRVLLASAAVCLVVAGGATVTSSVGPPTPQVRLTTGTPSG